MNQAPLVSIIITSYNYRRYLPDAIDSALNQTYPNTEVIVVDDGSTDNSREVIAGYDGRIVPVLKENGGQASAFNAGFELSRGDVICFLDSDDALFPTAIARAADLLRDEEVAKVHWPLSVVDAQGNDTGKVVPSRALPEGDLRETVMRGGPCSYGWPPTSGNAWARRFLEQILSMPEQEYKVWPDLYLSALAPVFGPMRKIAEPQGLWRIHGENSSWRDPLDERLSLVLRMWDHSCDVLARYCRRLGIAVDPETWKQDDTYYAWLKRMRRATEEIAALIPAESTFILADEDQWVAGEAVAGSRRIPFLERHGHYWGTPPDDETAIRELERLRQAGASHIVFGWPAFWWLDHYAGFHDYLRVSFRCVLENERLIAFRLRP
jgi:glycosyltransferase involved in cell wall biosynthesis